MNEVIWSAKDSKRTRWRKIVTRTNRHNFYIIPYRVYRILLVKNFKKPVLSQLSLPIVPNRIILSLYILLKFNISVSVISYGRWWINQLSNNSIYETFIIDVCTMKLSFIFTSINDTGRFETLLLFMLLFVYFERFSQTFVNKIIHNPENLKTMRYISSYD